MLPSPSSSPRSIFQNRTNIPQNVAETPTQVKPKCWFTLPTPPEHASAKRPSTTVDTGSRKRARISVDSDSDTDNEVQERRLAGRGLLRRKSVGFPFFGRQDSHIPTTSILQSFVSSQKSDIFKCQSIEIDSYLSPPYTCSYTHGAKRGAKSLLAVATEQGVVYVIDTSRRNAWEPEPQRTILHAHNNGIFDVKWNESDTLLATCSADQSTKVTCVTTSETIQTLRGHSGTVKKIAWHPTHRDLLCTGGRDGAICVWDLRVGENRTDDASTLSPVMIIADAHEDVQPTGKCKPRKGHQHAPKTVTGLLYKDTDPYELISSSSFDGILRCWDVRYLPKKMSSTKRRSVAAICHSSFDPTIGYGSRRSRGIVNLTAGSGPTAGILFALGTDSRIHTYSLPSLTPQRLSYTHANMLGNSFYLGLSVSPCGRWLASGNGGAKGGNFLFDVGNAARPFAVPEKAVELRGQKGEVGALDWADGMLATGADDGTVRVWRPDVEVYRSCIEDPEEKKWDWSWSVRNI